MNWFGIFSGKGTADDFYETDICNSYILFYALSENRNCNFDNFTIKKKLCPFKVINFLSIPEENKRLLIHVLLLNKYEACW